MNKKLEDALSNVEMTYSDVVKLANDAVDNVCSSANELVEEIKLYSNSLTVDQIRDYILRLQLMAFQISEVKEKAAFKSEIAESLQKEAMAVSFNSLEGPVTTKEKISIISTSSETVSKALYGLISDLMRTKLDQLHRLVSVLQSILMSRMQETKFMNIGATSEVGQTFPPRGNMKLNENI